MTSIEHLDHHQLLQYQSMKKSPPLCALVELVGLFFGLGGLGVMVAGKVWLGVANLLGYWALLAVVFVISFGAGGFLIGVPLWFIWVAISVVSAAQLAGKHNRELVERLASTARAPQPRQRPQETAQGSGPGLGIPIPERPAQAPPDALEAVGGVVLKVVAVVLGVVLAGGAAVVVLQLLL